MKLRCENLVKKYGPRTVVKGVSMEVNQGEIVGFLGPNGAGKTTSFYMITGLIVPNDGKIFLDDEDITKLPFTTKDDLRDNYPFGLFAVPKKDLVRIHASSGTTGKPTVVGYTKKDLDTWTECVSRIACMGGATDKDVAQICFGYGMFTGALGLHYGLEKIGAAIVPSSTGNSEKQLMYMKDFETSLLVATPSYALHLGEEVRARGLDPAKDLNIKIGLFGGAGTNTLVREFLTKYNLPFERFFNEYRTALPMFYVCVKKGVKSKILKQLYEINICVCKSCGGHLGKPQLRIPQRC